MMLFRMRIYFQKWWSECPIQKVLLDIIVFIALLAILYAGSYIPVYLNFVNSIPQRVYLGLQEFPIDNLGSLMFVQRGFTGEWMSWPIESTVIPKFKTFIRLEYFSLGHIARFFNIDAFTMYIKSMPVLGFLYALCIWYLVQKSVPRSSRILVLLCIFLAAPIAVSDYHDPWYPIFHSSSQVFQRIVMTEQHYVLSSIFSLLSLYSFVNFFQQRKLYVYILSLLTGFGAMMVFPPAMLVAGSAIGMYCLYNLVKQKWQKSLVRSLFYCLGYAVVVSLPALYFKSLTSHYHYYLLEVTERRYAISFSIKDYSQLVATMLIPCFVAIPTIFKKQQHFLIVLVFYLFSHMIFCFLPFEVFRFNPLRYIQVPYFVAYGMVGGYGIFLWYRLLLRKFNRVISGSLLGVIILLLFTPSLPAYSYSWKYVQTRYGSGFDIGYVLEDDYMAMQWLNKSGKINVPILTSAFMGSILMALTPDLAYVTDWIKVYPPKQSLYDDIMNPQTKFYTHQFTDSEAKEFLRNNHIQYVYFGTFERNSFGLRSDQLDLSYPFLSQIYGNTTVKIYQIN